MLGLAWPRGLYSQMFSPVARASERASRVSGSSGYAFHSIQYFVTRSLASKHPCVYCRHLKTPYASSWLECRAEVRLSSRLILSCHPFYDECLRGSPQRVVPMLPSLRQDWYREPHGAVLALLSGNELRSLLGDTNSQWSLFPYPRFIS